MRTLLVIADQGGFGAAVEAILAPLDYRLCFKNKLDTDLFSLTPPLIDACLLDAELIDVAPLRLIERLRQHFTACPIIVYTADKKREWEEEAYLAGVSHILSKPLRAELLNHLLAQVCNSEESAEPLAVSPVQSEKPASPNFELLKHVTRLFQHGNSSEGMLQEALLVVRELFCINRAAIFVRDEMSPGAGVFCVRCAAGIPPLVLEAMQLTSNKGIAQQIQRSGRVLKYNQAAPAAKREFDALGAQIAIPISDREQLLGFAAFDCHLTGEPLSDNETQILFQFLEGVGFALKAIQSHEAITSQESLLGDTLAQLSCGCVVIEEPQQVIHSNAAATKIFFPESLKRPLTFRDLPQEIGSRIFQGLNSGTGETFHYRVDDSSPVYLCQLSSFRRSSRKTVLLVMDDVSHMDRLRQLEVETSSLRLIKQMAVHLSHEIGNAILPVITSQQLKRNAPSDEKLSRLDSAVSSGLRRINRLTRQMQFLADDGLASFWPVSVSELLASAVEEAQLHHPGNSVVIEGGVAPNAEPTVMCDKSKLGHALAEVVLNALQASPDNAPVRINWLLHSNPSQIDEICISVTDTGSGFTPETAQRAVEPFFSTRTVGMGLGLTVANRIIEMHNGRLGIQQNSKVKHGAVRITIPLTPLNPPDEA